MQVAPEYLKKKKSIRIQMPPSAKAEHVLG